MTPMVIDLVTLIRLGHVLTEPHDIVLDRPVEDVNSRSLVNEFHVSSARCFLWPGGIYRSR